MTFSTLPKHRSPGCSWNSTLRPSAEPIKRGSNGMRRVSKKAARKLSARRACVKFVLERDNWTCQIKAPGCTGRATTGHEPLTRGRGGDPTDPAQVIASCDWCNNYVSNVNPKWAELNGKLKSQFLMGKHEASVPTIRDYYRQATELQKKDNTLTKGNI